MLVGQQRQRPAALSPPGVEDDGAGLGYAQGAPCQYTFAMVEFLAGEPDDLPWMQSWLDTRA